MQALSISMRRAPQSRVLVRKSLKKMVCISWSLRFRGSWHAWSSWDTNKTSLKVQSCQQPRFRQTNSAEIHSLPTQRPRLAMTGVQVSFCSATQTLDAPRELLWDWRVVLSDSSTYLRSQSSVAILCRTEPGGISS